jgi:hypothetical protein
MVGLAIETIIDAGLTPAPVFPATASPEASEKRFFA